MASKDRYEIEVQCPKCSSKSVLNISENDYPFMSRFGIEQLRLKNILPSISNIRSKRFAKVHGYLQRERTTT